MTLKTRVAKLESRIGHKRVPTDREYRDAMVLLDRRCRALEWPEIWPDAPPADPEEVALMRVAEENGQIAAARDVCARYDRARGVLTPEEMGTTQAELDAKARQELLDFYVEALEQNGETAIADSIRGYRV